MAEQKDEQKLESVEDLYAKLEKSDAKSLLKKYLSADIFAALKDKKTKQGCDFRSCIRSGIDNLDSGVGVYASDADAYVVFADLLNPMIMDYHKLKSLKGFAHPKQNFAFDDAFPADLDPDNKFIISTRVRVARNVEGYPLRGGMSKVQTLEFEAKIKAILEGFQDDDLKGKYYPLNNMDEDTRKQLVADHFLFKKGDRFLESAGINNDWPFGRGIFFNTNKTFLVWVNEEDQLRIISMQQGANIKAVFVRLQKAVAAINDKLEFAYNAQLGYLTACPTNIGCGERASVHIKVPLTSQNKQLFDDIAKRNNLQIRGVHGEHSESKGGVYDVSNKRRLGITEWDGVKDLITGCKELIESESKLQSEEKGDQKDEEKEQTAIELHPLLVQNEYPAAELAKCKGLMAKHLTKDLFEKLKELKTANGFMLKNAINTGVKNPQSLVGIHAGDIESYSLFNDIFGVVIEDYHQTKTYHNGIKSSFSADSDEKQGINEGDIPNIKNIKSTRIRVARNIDGFPLAPSQTDVAVKLEIEGIMKKVFATLQSDADLKGQYYPLYGMEEKVRQQFIDDHFLFSGDDDPMQTDSGYHLWFPKGRGIYLNEAKTFIVWLNEGDHLRLISMERTNNVKGVFDRLKKAVIAMEAGIKKVTNGKSNGFLFDKQYGNVTCCPTNLGTGLRASVHISLPELCKEGLDKLNDIGIKYKMQIRGLYGEHSEIAADAVVDISNKFRMGYSELTLVQFMCDGVNELNKMEKDLEK